MTSSLMSLVLYDSSYNNTILYNNLELDSRKLNVQNRLLEYFCTEKQITHRTWFDIITSRHSSKRIQRLAKNSVDSYKKEL
ncbi:unnamed protein product [Rhizophagus irregularis]|nr:unnamed protein product [Rhizophagus irregularis]CAB5374595.1 unnamed protein product [Rhizophagus irregularis]